MSEIRGARNVAASATTALRIGQNPAFGQLAQAQNLGLALERYQPVPRGDAERYRSFLKSVCDLSPPAIYTGAYEEWKTTLENLPGVCLREFETRGRVIVGLGAESVRETGITLLRLYGVPVLPGSALKGLARRYLSARGENWTDDERKEILRIMFGTGPERKAPERQPEERNGASTPSGYASHLTYFDAWYVPNSAPDNRPLRLDVITVHHPRYYRSQGKSANKDKAEGEENLPPVPWDLDDPTPVAFLSVRGSFLVAVRGPDADRQWATQAMTILEHALADWGIGAKTSSGYGRLVPADNGGSPAAEQSASQSQVSALASEITAINIAALSEPELKALLRDYATNKVGDIQDSDGKTRVRRAIFEKVKEAGKIQAWKGELWLSRLAVAIEERL
mgnify:CR=1 FL=1